METLATWSQMKYIRFIKAAGGWSIFQQLLNSLEQVAKKHQTSIANIAAKYHGNASERINLQHIMVLREAFDLADTDHGGALEIEEFIEAFTANGLQPVVLKNRAVRLYFAPAVRLRQPRIRVSCEGPRHRARGSLDQTPAPPPGSHDRHSSSSCPSSH